MRPQFASFLFPTLMVGSFSGIDSGLAQEQPTNNSTAHSLSEKSFSDEYAADEKSEASPTDPCRDDSDCWCRQFNGAHFRKGRSPGKCCKDETKDYCNKVGFCNQCVYK